MDSERMLPRRAPGAELLGRGQCGVPHMTRDAQVSLYLVRMLGTVLGGIEYDLLRDGDLDPARTRSLADTLTEFAKVIRARNPDIIDSTTVGSR